MGVEEHKAEPQRKRRGGLSSASVPANGFPIKSVENAKPAATRESRDCPPRLLNTDTAVMCDTPSELSGKRIRSELLPPRQAARGTGQCIRDRPFASDRKKRFKTYVLNCRYGPYLRPFPQPIPATLPN